MPGLFADALDPQLSQGDIFPPDWDYDQRQRLGPLLLLSHSCEVDKSTAVLAADIVTDLQTPAGLLGDIRRGRVFHTFYLEGSTFGGWANLRTARPIDCALLRSHVARRTQPMSEEGRAALAGKFFSFLTRALPPSSA